MENKNDFGCTHDCSTCHSSCFEEGDVKPSVFDKFNSFVEGFLTDDGFERLGRIVAEIEADEAKESK